MIALLFDIEGFIKAIWEIENEVDQWIHEEIAVGMALLFPSIEAAQIYVHSNHLQVRA